MKDTIATEAEFIQQYEDQYAGCVHTTYEGLLKDAHAYWIGDFAHWNIPVWIDYEDGLVSVGVLLTRHGETCIHAAPATPEQVEEIRRLIMRVTIGRADAGFERYMSLLNAV